MRAAFGVDIGGTTIKFGAFSPDGELLEKWFIDTDIEDNGNRIIPDVAESIRSYVVSHGMTMEDVIGVGMGIPGPVDDNGHVRVCINLNWKDFNPVKEFQKIFPELRVAAGNDANVAALGEYHKGGGRQASSMMMVTLGTGVGGGIIINGKMINGACGLAGEIGHIGVNPEPVARCNCGNWGCINECSSATGIAVYAKHYLETEDTPSSLRDLEVITAKDVCDHAKAGDEIALLTMRKCMAPLGTAMAFFSHAFDPEVYVIGGGVSHAGQWLVDIIREGFDKHFHLVEKGCEIRLAELGNDAGIIGACMLVAAE